MTLLPFSFRADQNVIFPVIAFDLSLNYTSAFCFLLEDLSALAFQRPQNPALLLIDGFYFSSCR